MSPRASRTALASLLSREDGPCLERKRSFSRETTTLLSRDDRPAVERRPPSSREKAALLCPAEDLHLDSKRLFTRELARLSSIEARSAAANRSGCSPVQTRLVPREGQPAAERRATCCGEKSDLLPREGRPAAERRATSRRPKVDSWRQQSRFLSSQGPCSTERRSGGSRVPCRPVVARNVGEEAGDRELSAVTGARIGDDRTCVGLGGPTTSRSRAIGHRHEGNRRVARIRAMLSTVATWFARYSVHVSMRTAALVFATSVAWSAPAFAQVGAPPVAPVGAPAAAQVGAPVVAPVPPAPALRPPVAQGSTDVPYPPGAQGDAAVLLELVVDEDGYVTSALVVEGAAPFAEQARRAVLAWRFAPARRGDTPVAAKIRARVEFHQDGTARRVFRGHPGRHGLRARPVTALARVRVTAAARSRVRAVASFRVRARSAPRMSTCGGSATRLVRRRSPPTTCARCRARSATRSARSRRCPESSPW